MAISGTITLLTASTNMSSFDLYSCTSSNGASCSGTAFETNVTRSQLLNGFVSNSIPDGTTYIKINPTTAGCLNQYIIVELSGAPSCSFDATIVYGLPSVTPTPTPTGNGTPSSGCISISESTNTTQDVRCPDNYSGQYYNRTTNIVTIQLLSAYEGIPVVATQNIQVAINIDYYAVNVPGGGGYSPYVETVTILQGQSQTTFQYESQTIVQNPYDSNCEQETKSIVGIESISPNSYTECLPPPSATPTPTPTIPSLGQCYTYTLDHVSDTAYGVSYISVGGGLTSNQFNSIPSIQISDGVYSYSICSEEYPTLLDYTGPGPIGIGGADGITYSGPNGNCTTNFDCYTN